MGRSFVCVTTKTAAKTKSKPARKVVRPEGTTQLNVNLPSELMSRVDAWILRINARLEGARWTRTDIVRTVLSKALEAHAEKGESP